MTRINCVPPEELHGKHLVAEYRELPRVFSLVKAAMARGEKAVDSGSPTEYILGKGHVRFFYDKCLWLLRRQQSLIREMRSRGMNPKFEYPNDLVQGIDAEWMGDWEPTEDDMALNRARIMDRMPK